MPQASVLTPESRFFAMFVGPSGSGKTVAAASFPKPVEIQDFDGRIRGLLGAPWIDRSGITYEPWPPREKGMIARLNSRLELMETQASINQPLPKTEILDSLTSECFAMLCQSVGLTHTPAGPGQKKVGKYLGVTPMMGPEDYGFEATNTYSILAFLRSLPIQNVIVSAHVIDVFGKSDPNDDYSASIKIGEKLSVRDKIAANIGIYFDHVFRFEKYEINGREKYTVRFRGSLARTSYADLPSDEVDITGKNFYETMMSYIQKPQLIQTAS